MNKPLLAALPETSAIPQQEKGKEKKDDEEKTDAR
jgi:hypothetical protein